MTGDVTPPRRPDYGLSTMRTVRVLVGVLVLSACAKHEPNQNPTSGEGAGEGVGGGAGAGAQSRPAATTKPKHPLGFLVWHDDLPITVPLSPHTMGHWYPRTASQALEQVVKNLSGSCTQDAWHFARDFFKRAPADAEELLISEMERSFLAPDRGEIVENIVDAMGAAARPVFAPSLLRATTHSREGVRSKSMAAMVFSGTKESVLAARKNWDKLDPRCKLDWVRAAPRYLGDELVPIFHEILETSDLQYLHKEVQNQIRTMPAEKAIAIVKPLYERANKENKLYYALILHQKGDKAGTIVMRDAMRSDQPGLKAAVLEACAGTDFEWLLPEVLKCSNDDDAGVRRAAAIALGSVPGKNVDNVLEVLGLDRDDQVRRVALFWLRKRGQRKLLDETVAAIPTASGTRLRTLIEDASAAADGAAVPAIMSRYEQVRAQSPPEARDLLRTVAFMRAPEAFEPLAKVFLGPIYNFDPAGRLNSRDYAATLLANLTGEEPRVLALYESIPKSDPARRVLALHTLGNLATHAARESAELIYSKYRALVADRSEEPQVRMLALTYLRKDMRLEDAIKVKKMLEGEDEPMRRALNDFLFEFF